MLELTGDWPAVMPDVLARLEHARIADVDSTALGALGTVVRGRMVRRLAADSGFGRSGALPVGDDCFRLYRLDP